MSAYTLSSGDLLNSRWSTVVSLVSNQMWMLMTGTPSRPLSCLKKGVAAQGSGHNSFMMSTGMALMYRSPWTYRTGQDGGCFVGGGITQQRKGRWRCHGGRMGVSAVVTGGTEWLPWFVCSNILCKTVGRCPQFAAPGLTPSPLRLA